MHTQPVDVPRTARDPLEILGSNRFQGASAPAIRRTTITTCSCARATCGARCPPAPLHGPWNIHAVARAWRWGPFARRWEAVRTGRVIIWHPYEGVTTFSYFPAGNPLDREVPSGRMLNQERQPADTGGNEDGSPRQTIRIVLADDHPVVRSGVRLLLDGEPDFEVVAEAGDLESARRYVRGHHPDVLVLDLNIPGGSSLEAISEIRAEDPSTQIVVLTMHRETAFARHALSAGAIGYVLKEAANDELMEAMRRAAAGESYLNPRLGARLASEPPAGAPADLSERELDVLRLISLGYTNAEIADQLFLSVRTIESHRARIQEKLSLASRAELVGYALRHGLIPPEPEFS